MKVIPNPILTASGFDISDETAMMSLPSLPYPTPLTITRYEIHGVGKGTYIYIYLVPSFNQVFHLEKGRREKIRSGKNKRCNSILFEPVTDHLWLLHTTNSLCQLIFGIVVFSVFPHVMETY